MAVLSREAILSAEDLGRELVAVPEWGGEVYVRVLPGAERDQFEIDSLDSAGPDARFNRHNVRARLAARCVVGEDGRRLFADADVEALGDKSGAALDRIFDVAMRLNRMRRQDVEELVKNSPAARNGSSGSA